MVEKLFVGQRVRIVGTSWIGYGSCPAGLEGFLEVPKEHGLITRKEYDWCVRTDCGLKVLCDSHEVEPILPEGAQPLGYSFEQMMSEFGVTEAVK